ncbi:MAG: FAD-dependent oxidoreductase [Deltaproteobacteria bacterium]|nr:FAD-dependent oxidoreductase [Deltaproteobacteria bacterium]
MTEKAALVIGGGIAGIQTSIDLAGMGHRVYLVEKHPSIGGRMAQLDKTFPTNDCAMCILAPKMIECANHENIELLTYSELKELTGRPGNFKVRILRKARFVDEEKCVGCGDCAEVCPVKIVDDFNAGLGQKGAIYKYFPQAVPSTFAVERKDRAPCVTTCPAGINVQGYIQLIGQEKYMEAIQLIMEQLPLPGVLGRICPHPCEVQCRRLEKDYALAIRDLKRFAADRVNLEELPMPAIRDRSERVAVIGSGPAGLTVAYYLRLKGYQVTIFEALPVLGGMLRVGIPDYRLPPDILDQEIQAILRLGIDVETGKALGRDFTLKDLRKEGFSALFVGTGAHRSIKMNIPGEEDFEGVLDAVDFLREVNLGQRVSPGKRVVIIGGGNVAVDAARTAIRLGSREVSIVYRRSRKEMPAYPEEIEEALEEGIKIHYLTAPLGIRGSKGKVTGFECIETRLGPPDDSGRRRPVPVKGSEFLIRCDTVIPAIGQRPDLGCLEGPGGPDTSSWSTLVVNNQTMQTSIPHVFASGDVVSGPATVIEAVGSGHRAAEAIDRFLKGEDLEAFAKEMEAALPPGSDWEDIPERTQSTPRAMVTLKKSKDRVKSFDEVSLGLSESEVQREVSRCLNCGICCDCRQCVTACKAEAVDLEQKEKEVTLEVGAVVLATGFDLYDVSPLVEYGWGRIENVITAMQFERMICASGPSSGHLQRPSDGREPMNLAFIQCVGSRDVRHKRYCSAVCCMHATKEAVLAREHYPGLTSTIFYMDMRAVGKGFQEYIRRAKSQYGVEYIRTRPGTVRENEKNRNPIIHYEDTVNRKFTTREFDMVILAQALAPSEGNLSISEKLGVDLDEFGFVATPGEITNPLGTSREGVFACGFCQTPMDVPDSVVRASAAACKAAEVLAMVREKV